VNCARRTAEPGPACRGQDPTFWDLDHQVHTSLFARCDKCARAVAICTGCPVRLACRADATRFGDVHTIRGGRALASTSFGRPEPVPECEVCGLPVLRGRRARCCSVLCTRIRAAAARRDEALAA
jgi:hypothetical protein